VRKELAIDVAPPETRVALTEDGRAVEVFHERRQRRGLVGNVCLGRVHRVLPGIHAAFVSIGLERDAFLYVEDVLPHAPDLDSEEPVARRPGDRSAAPPDRPRIDELVKEGQEVVVQVTKDPFSGKGPRVSASVSLPGRKLVYLPAVREVGISRRITDESERARLRQILEGFGAAGATGGFIARTAAQGSSAAELESDRRYLEELWARISAKAERATAPALLHRELDLALRIARDLAGPDLDAILVNDRETYERLGEFLTAVAPPLASRLQLYDRAEPIFELFGIEAQIESALQNQVPLPSGGSLVIHQTEALVAIDVNTGRFVGTDALEDTVFVTNLEAVDEVARQIRLRDLGGLLVVDFIDMEDPGHRREVFEKLQAALAKDRARTRLLQVSDFGLVEITRQRSRGNLEKTLTRACPECAGSGRVKTDLTVALELRRALLKAESLYAPGDTVRVRVRPSLARLVGEEDSSVLADVQERLGVTLELLPDPALSADAFEILSR
jgi:ribonuclease G